jgi:hypothetical protein
MMETVEKEAFSIRIVEKMTCLHFPIKQLGNPNSYTENDYRNYFNSVLPKETEPFSKIFDRRYSPKQRE